MTTASRASVILMALRDIDAMTDREHRRIEYEAVEDEFRERFKCRCQRRLAEAVHGSDDDSEETARMLLNNIGYILDRIVRLGPQPGMGAGLAAIATRCETMAYAMDCTESD